MEVECIILAGAWRVIDGGNWDFDIDKKMMCRVVHFTEISTIEEVCAKVITAFADVTNVNTVSLSYLAPDLEILGIGKRTPPVVCTTNDSIKSCYRLLLKKKLNYLYGSFVQTEPQAIYMTPCLGQKRKITNSVGGSTNLAPCTSCQSPQPSQETLDEAMKTKKFIAELKEIEDTMKSSGKKPVQPTARLLCLDVDGDSDSSEETLDADEVDVTSRGYDQEFWDPLLEESFGGSNAVSIMLEPDDDIPLSQQSVVRDANHPHITKSPGLLPTNFRFVQSSTGEQSTTTDVVDIPSMFDDIQYQTAIIPDLESDDGEIIIEVGKIFINKKECQIALAIYAIKNMFQFLQRRTTKKHFVVTCADIKCSWYVNAREIRDSTYYRINKVHLEHSCSIETRSKYPKMATAKVIAHVFQSKYAVAETGPKPRNLQQLVLEDLRVSTSYSKCWRANQSANEQVRGTEEESYLQVESYLHMLKLANPGSITGLKTVRDGEGVEKFLYLFLAFGASIHGFKMLRPVIVLDGTHLTGKYKGVLLTASGQDANFQVFPLAFAVVDAENDKSWNWFLSKLKEITDDIPSLAIISDRHQSIAKGVKSVFKYAKHGVCIVHLARNVVTKFKNKGLANLVMEAASAYRIKQFDAIFGKIRSKSARCAKWLEEIGFQNWSRVHFLANRYNIMTSNIAESLNNALRSARRGTIMELLRFIQSMLMKWFSVRREKSLANTGFLTPEVDRIITSNLKLTKGSKVTSSSAWSFEVVGLLGHRSFVQLSEKRCTCKIYDTLKIPCGHALIAAGDKNFPFERLVGDHYKSSAWANTYQGMITPTDYPGDHKIPLEIASRTIHPPTTKRPCGRPKVNRIPSAGEIRDPKKQKKCGRCGKIGHNKTSCKNPI